MKKQLHSQLAPRRPGTNRSRSGFTLLEVMMVVIILGILITIGISGLNIKGNTDKAKKVKTQAAIAELHSAILMYEGEHNKYPATLETLKTERIMNKIKTDGWGKALQYNQSNGEVWSDGGTTGAKISSLDL